MSVPTQRSAYKGHFEVLDRALDADRGIRVGFEDQGEAMNYRMRLYKARELDRKLNSEARERDDPDYGISEYDGLFLRVRFDDDRWWVYIERGTALPVTIEELEA